MNAHLSGRGINAAGPFKRARTGSSRSSSADGTKRVTTGMVVRAAAGDGVPRRVGEDGAERSRKGAVRRASESAVLGSADYSTVMQCPREQSCWLQAIFTE